MELSKLRAAQGLDKILLIAPEMVQSPEPSERAANGGEEPNVPCLDLGAHWFWRYHARMENLRVFGPHKPLLSASCTTCVSACFFLLSLYAPAQETKYPPMGSVDGPALFRGYCAPCHGADGKGSGPAASSLKSKVADLTVLGKRAGGTFPRDRIRNILEGKQTPRAHGSREMPVWGPVFHQIEADRDMGGVRVENLVNYIETLQRK